MRDEDQRFKEEGWGLVVKILQLSELQKSISKFSSSEPNNNFSNYDKKNILRNIGENY